MHWRCWVQANIRARTLAATGAGFLSRWHGCSPASPAPLKAPIPAGDEILAARCLGTHSLTRNAGREFRQIRHRRRRQHAMAAVSRQCDSSYP